MKKHWIWAILVVVAFSIKCESAAATSKEIVDENDDASIATTTAKAIYEEKPANASDTPDVSDVLVTDAVTYEDLIRDKTSDKSPRKVYHVNTDFTANWYRAFHYCAHNNLTLATIDTKDEFDSILELIRETKFKDSFWIGLRKLGHQTFYWFGHKKPVTYDYTYAESEKCSACACATIEVDDESFTGTNCNELNYFVCESIE